MYAELINNKKQKSFMEEQNKIKYRSEIVYNV